MHLHIAHIFYLHTEYKAGVSEARCRSHSILIQRKGILSWRIFTSDTLVYP